MASEQLAAAIERYHAAGAELVKGNPEPQKSMFSRGPDVVLVSPAGVVARGWDEVAATVEQASSRFRDGEVEFERVADVLTPALACIVEIERWRATFDGRGVFSGELRVSTVLRPEDGAWRVVQRHADQIGPAPFLQSARSQPSRTAVSRPLVVEPGAGLSVENPVGGILTFKVRSEESDGQLTALETIAAPGEGPPLHLHRHEDEFIYTLEGELRLKLADELVEAGPGSFVFIPRGTPHTWQNVGATPGRFLAGVTPAAVEFEEFFVRYGELADDERGAAAFGRLAAELNALEVVGPPLAQSSR